MQWIQFYIAIYTLILFHQDLKNYFKFISDKYQIPVLSAHQNIVHRVLAELDRFLFLLLGVVPIFDRVAPEM